MDEPSDDALMLAYAGGEAAAFERLYARHQAALYRFVRRLLGTALAAQADEVFQDTWLRVVQARGRWMPHEESATAEPGEPELAEPGGEPPIAGSPPPPRPGTAQFRTWLFTIAHHRAVDLWRRSGREVAVDATDDAAPWQPDAGGGAAWQQWPAPEGSTARTDDLAFWRRAGVRLLNCLDELPLPQRSTFLLHHDDGLPLDEVALAVGVGFETAKTRLRYAMSKLRTCMGAYLSPREGGWA